MSDPRTFVIVGAGQAGRWLALQLRADGFTGRVVWFGSEPHLPYQRPPLSKAVLTEPTELQALSLIDARQLEALQVQWRPGETVVSIDRGARTVCTQQGDVVGYDLLFLANGGRPRPLPGLAPHPRILTLRTWDDALVLRGQLAEARSVLVLGGGWIGLEVAASARRLGLDVTVVEAASRLCSRTMPPCVSDLLRALHEAHGVELRLGTVVDRVEAGTDQVAVRLGNGDTPGADLLVLGIGLVANDELAAAAGLATGHGVLVDAQGRSSDAHIFAVGDVAHGIGPDGRRQRIESWENAQRQAVAAAKAALGLPHDPAAEGPGWFWSDQYDCNLQVLGQPHEDHTLVVREAPDKGQRLLFFIHGQRIEALAAVNAGREVKLVRKWMREGRFPSPDRLADPGVELNKLPLIAAVPSNVSTEQ